MEAPLVSRMKMATKPTASREMAKKMLKTTRLEKKTVMNVITAMPAQLQAAPTPMPKAEKSRGKISER